MFYLEFALFLASGESKHIFPKMIRKQQFYLKNDGQNQGVPNEDINISSAFDSGLYGEGVSILIYGNESFPNHFNDEDEIKKPENIPESLYYDILAPFIGNDRKNMMQISSFPLTEQCKRNKFEVEKYNEKFENTFSPKFVRGRNGLGWIAVFTPQECFGLASDPNYRLLTQLRFAINVAATTNRGDRAYYSPRSSNLLFNVPSTDTSVNYGNNITINPLYTEAKDHVCMESPIKKMTAANAIATGALAVILQANKFISWRDLQLVLALSSTVNDANHSSWVKNAANVMYSNIYGFCRLNVGKALEIASKIDDLPTEIHYESTNSYNNSLIPSCRCAPLKIIHNVDSKIDFIETIHFSFSTDHESIGDLVIEITSPSGTKAIINDVTLTEKISGVKKFGFTARQFLGEPASGNWIVTIGAAGCIPTGRIQSSSLRFFGVEKVSFATKKLLEDSSSDEVIGDIFPQPISYTKYTQLPCNNTIKLSIENHTEKSVLKPGENLTFHISNLGNLSNKPAILFYTTSDPDKAGAKSYDVIQFNHARMIENYKILPPLILAGKSNFTYIFNIIDSPDNIISTRCGTFSVSEIAIEIPQYEVIQRNIHIFRPYSLSSTNHDDNILTTIIDYDNKTVIEKSIGKNTGYVSFSIPDTATFYRGILTVQPISLNPDPCSVFVHAFYVDNGSNKYDIPFKFNESSTCSKISGLDYQEWNEPSYAPTIVTASPTVSYPSQTQQPNNIQPTDAEEDGKENNLKTKTAIITIVSIFSVCIILTLVGVVVLITRVHIRSKEAATKYTSDDNLSPVTTL